jgi:hypothetical protein
MRDTKGNEMSMVFCDECGKGRKQRVPWQFWVAEGTSSFIADTLD